MEHGLGTNRYWPLGGRGFASFGLRGGLACEPIPEPGADEVLARVDAYAVCASDVKMVTMGNAYPLFKGRDFKRHPARLGHELSLVVARAGRNRAPEWRPGMRLGVQPDVYLDGERFCIGVTVAGGMAEYILLGAEVFSSDRGCCAFRAPDDLSLAAVAQTEPAACVEAAFADHARRRLDVGSRTLVWVAQNAEKRYDLSALSRTRPVFLFDPNGRAGSTVAFGASTALTPIDGLPAASFDLVIIVGNPAMDTMTGLIDLLAEGAVLCWLPERVPEPFVMADIARVHYGRLTFAGSMSGDLARAIASACPRCDYLPRGTLVISGGAGAMGRFHVMRALQHASPPARIIVVGRGVARLDSMAGAFGELARARGVRLDTVSARGARYRALRSELLDVGGVSDLVICAPGPEPIEETVDLLAPNGTMVLFSGTSFGQVARIPLGHMAAHGATVTGWSGSTVSDQLSVIDRMGLGEADLNINVAAIAGMRAGREALEAVRARMFAGKVIVYPRLFELPLVGVDDLARLDGPLAREVSRNGWSKLAETMLFSWYEKRYGRKDA